MPIQCMRKYSYMIYLQELSFFKNFPPELISKIQKCAEIKKVNRGDVIIQQGKQNNTLYFLINGLLNVYVDEGLVAKLQKEGDLVGEMSLISQKKSGATIIADTAAELLAIDGEALHQLASESGAGEYNLYKIYSDILVQKLEITNQRANKIEAFADELKIAREKLEAANASLEVKVKDRTAKLEENLESLKQKNNELQATHNKMQELYQNRDVTFSSLQNLLNKNLVPLQDKIADFKSQHKVDDEAFNSVEAEVLKAIRQLEPLAISFANEKSMTSKKVLFAEPIKKQQTVAKMALGGTGVELDIVQTADEARLALSNTKYDIFMFSESFLELTEFAKQKNPNMEFVFVTSKNIPQYVPTLLGHQFVPNVVFRDEEDKQFTIKNFVTTISKLASGNYFGLEKYVSWGVDVQEVSAKSSADRPKIIEAMDDYFAKMGIRSTNRERLKVVAEELLMNAIYDAPLDEKGKPLYNHKDRTEVVILKESHRPTFRYATDGNLMAVSIEDPFGGLDANTLFRYLERCYSGSGSLNDDINNKGGGGRGLHQIIENSNLVVFNINPGKRTEVIALFNTDVKSVAHRSPNLHYFKTAS